MDIFKSYSLSFQRVIGNSPLCRQVCGFFGLRVIYLEYFRSACRKHFQRGGMDTAFKPSPVLFRNGFAMSFIAVDRLGYAAQSLADEFVFAPAILIFH